MQSYFVVFESLVFAASWITTEPFLQSTATFPQECFFVIGFWGNIVLINLSLLPLLCLTLIGEE